MGKQSRPLVNVTAIKGAKPQAAFPTATVTSLAESSAPKAGRTVAVSTDESWSEVANFVVTFERREVKDGGPTERRITAHKMQDDGITAKWTGEAQQPMCEWIADHVGDWAEAEPAQPAPATISGDKLEAAPLRTAQPTLTLAISQVRAVQTGADHGLGRTAAREQGSRASFKNGDTLDVEATIEVSGLRQSDLLHKPSACSVQFFCRNATTGGGLRLGEASITDLVESNSTHRAVLSHISLPAGIYRLESVASLQGALPPLVYAQGPLLEVV